MKHTEEIYGLHLQYVLRERLWSSLNFHKLRQKDFTDVWEKFFKTVGKEQLDPLVEQHVNQSWSVRSDSNTNNPDELIACGICIRWQKLQVKTPFNNSWVPFDLLPITPIDSCQLLLPEYCSEESGGLFFLTSSVMSAIIDLNHYLTLVQFHSTHFH